MVDNNHQLEILLSVEVCNLYQTLLGQRPTLTTCRFITDQELTIILESFLTPVEQLLLKGNRESLVTEARKNIDAVFHRQLERLIKKSSNRRILSLLFNSDILTDRKFIHIKLSPSPPQFQP